MNISFEITTAEFQEGSKEKGCRLSGCFDQLLNIEMPPDDRVMLSVEKNGKRDSIHGDLIDVSMRYGIFSTDGDSGVRFFANSFRSSDSNYNLELSLFGVDKDLIWRIYEAVENPKRRIMIHLFIPHSDTGPLKANYDSPLSEYTWNLDNDAGNLHKIDYFFFAFQHLDQNEQWVINERYELSGYGRNLNLSERLLLSLVDRVREFKRLINIWIFVALACFVFFPVLKVLFSRFFF